jgi:hypothetical protein
MPPPAILQNPVEQISRKLTQHAIPNAVILKTAETARILETRVKTGKLDKMDRKETRAAVLLELVYRQETKKRLPWKDLASAVGMKVANLEQLQLKINNYLQTPSRPGAGRTTASSSSTLRHGGGTLAALRAQQHHQQLQGPPSRKRPLAPTTRRSARVAPTGTIRTTTNPENHRRLEALAIRLSVHLMDLHGSCKKARQLLLDIQDYVDHNPQFSASDRRGMQYDLRRYEAAYEAAALYYVTCPASSGKTASKSRRARDDTNDEDRAQSAMTLDDLADASTEFSFLELKQVLPNVLDMGDKIAAKTKDALSSFQAKRPRTDVASQRQPDAAQNTKDDEDDNLVPEMEDLPDESQVLKEAVAAFPEWRENVLSQALERARKSLVEDAAGDEESPKSALSNSELLARAADDIIRKHGLLP